MDFFFLHLRITITPLKTKKVLSAFILKSPFCEIAFHFETKDLNFYYKNKMLLTSKKKLTFHYKVVTDN